MMEEINKIKTERIPLLLVFKEDGCLKTDISRDVNDYELWGFLKIFVERMKEQLKNSMIDRQDNDEIL